MFFLSSARRKKRFTTFLWRKVPKELLLPTPLHGGDVTAPPRCSFTNVPLPDLVAVLFPLSLLQQYNDNVNVNDNWLLLQQYYPVSKELIIDIYSFDESPM